MGLAEFWFKMLHSNVPAADISLQVYAAGGLLCFDGAMKWELFQQSPAGMQMGASFPVWEQFPAPVGVFKSEQEPCVFNCDHY